MKINTMLQKVCVYIVVQRRINVKITITLFECIKNEHGPFAAAADYKVQRSNRKLWRPLWHITVTVEIWLIPNKNKNKSRIPFSERVV